jgi:hypothetical protein
MAAGSSPPWTATADGHRGRPPRSMADGHQGSADVHIGRPLPRAANGQGRGRTGLAVHRLRGGRFRSGGGRPIQGVVRLTPPPFHLPLTTLDVLQLLLALVAPMWWRVGVLFVFYIHMVSLSTLWCSKLRPLLRSPPCTRMAAEPEHDVVTGEQGSLAARNSTKWRKPKGAHHAFDWEALEDPNAGMS